MDALLFLKNLDCHLNDQIFVHETPDIWASDFLFEDHLEVDTGNEPEDWRIRHNQEVEHYRERVIDRDHFFSHLLLDTVQRVLFKLVALVRLDDAKFDELLV